MYEDQAIENEYARSGIGDAFEEYEEEIELDKKNLWIGGVMHCFSILSSVCGCKDGNKQIEEKWEVPVDSIKDLVYLGAGAQGVVFGGTLNGRWVAVKKLRDKSETNIKHLRKLNHTNIVRFRGVCTVPPTYCIIMEYCQYGPLFDFLHSGATFSTKQILKWAKQIANGMSYLHSHKIIHRDLKSPNVLISDDLVLKVSDFGTSREWNDVSAIMSFTGTVAWMAPEVIRHELCSEKVDVWSYGVVLWELLTQEVPYRTMETHAIMWGVGTDSISLPIPSSCPGSLRALLTQCWHRIPRNRPPFKIIAAHLEIAGNELNAIRADNFSATQALWREEIETDMERILNRNNESLEAVETNNCGDQQRNEEVKTARSARNVYKQQLKRANDLYLEVCAVRLQLEQREKAVAEREKAVGECPSCFHKKIPFHRQISSSSDGFKGTVVMNLALDNASRRRRKKVDQIKPANLIVNYQPKRSNPNNVVTRKVTNCLGTACTCGKKTAKNNKMEAKSLEDGKVDTVVENNGNIVVKDKIYKNDNEKFLAELAQV
ncbi:mitogen-activated protein kinase kinase kinase 12 [Epargyreus clarus]|uniref:mitogen-activated protein kinase kinase kinase 12 n=1 Tax=Epargyreus clarus TaxID=520877 RepID=UPI003C2AD031